MPESLELVIGGGEHERLAVALLGRTSPESKDAYEGNWIEARVMIAVGGFRGSFECTLLAQDFARFLPQLRRLETELSGVAEFSSMEDQLGFVMRGDGQGHFEVEGHVSDQPGCGNRLAWSFSIDQTFLPAMVASVSAITAAYDVRGRRMSN
ncbi:MAG: hypothetical protein KDC98_19915 [Planctomycetes bacterium]|nr:hypothetical protein [Planctomycetota bacterium]